MGQEKTMTHDKITMLYRYTTAERAICVLTSRLIFIPKPVRFNDPFDCAIKFDREITAEELICASCSTYRAQGHDWASIKRILDKWIQDDGTVTKEKRKEMLETAQEFADSNAKMGVLSLSEIPLSPLMMAHYADQHRGVCIGFTRATGNKLGDDDITAPILYSDFYPRVRFGDILKCDGSLHKQMFFTKARDWAYEREWRMLVNNGDDYHPIPGDICEVIMGCRIDPANADAIQKICVANNITLYGCEPAPDKFEYIKTVK